MARIQSGSLLLSLPQLCCLCLRSWIPLALAAVITVIKSILAYSPGTLLFGHYIVILRANGGCQSTTKGTNLAVDSSSSGSIHGDGSNEVLNKT